MIQIASQRIFTIYHGLRRQQFSIYASLMWVHTRAQRYRLHKKCRRTDEMQIYTKIWPVQIVFFFAFNICFFRSFLLVAFSRRTKCKWIMNSVWFGKSVSVCGVCINESSVCVCVWQCTIWYIISLRCEQIIMLFIDFDVFLCDDDGENK